MEPFPNVGFWPRRDCFSQARPVHLTILTFTNKVWVMPGHHAIILTDASVAFFPGCVSCAFAKTKCRSLGGMKGTTLLKMIPLCKVSASFCCSNPFSASEHYFRLPLLIRFIMSLKSLLVPSSVLISACVTEWAK